MVKRRMILGAVVGKIRVAGGPVEAELALGFAAAETPESHVHGLYVPGVYGFVDDTVSSRVDGLDGGLGLRPTYFDE